MVFLFSFGYSWIFLVPLKDCFPNLFLDIFQKEAKVRDMGVWADGCWVWGNFGLPEQMRVVSEGCMYSLL